MVIQRQCWNVVHFPPKNVLGLFTRLTAWSILLEFHMQFSHLQIYTYINIVPFITFDRILNLRKFRRICPLSMQQRIYLPISLIRIRIMASPSNTSRRNNIRQKVVHSIVSIWRERACFAATYLGQRVLSNCIVVYRTRVYCQITRLTFRWNALLWYAFSLCIGLYVPSIVSRMTSMHTRGAAGVCI
jgi:hypothetical protein